MVQNHNKKISGNAVAEPGIEPPPPPRGVYKKAPKLGPQ